MSAMSEPRSSGKRSLHANRRWTETPDLADAVARLMRSMGRRVAQEDERSLAALERLEDELAGAWADAVAGLRAIGVSDVAIGRELGITRQAVEQRWPRNPTPRRTQP